MVKSILKTFRARKIKRAQVSKDNHQNHHNHHSFYCETVENVVLTDFEKGSGSQFNRNLISVHIMRVLRHMGTDFEYYFLLESMYLSSGSIKFEDNILPLSN